MVGDLHSLTENGLRTKYLSIKQFMYVFVNIINNGNQFRRKKREKVKVKSRVINYAREVGAIK